MPSQDDRVAAAEIQAADEPLLEPKMATDQKCNPDRDLVLRGLPILKFTHVANKTCAKHAA